MEFAHKSVLLQESIEGLSIKPNGIYVDCTLGGGGHSGEILKRLNDEGRLIGIDKDKDAIDFATAQLGAMFEGKFVAVHGDFADGSKILDKLGVEKADGVIMDLGVSSYQLDNTERGFSYRGEALLDMRMDRSQELSAYEVVNEYGQAELKKIIKDYGEERFASAIAANIVKARAISPVRTTAQLVEIIDRSIPAAVKRTGGHPAKRTFQAIRIEVNGELRILENAVTQMVRRLKTGGRIAVITFHSLEDRIVKQNFNYLEKDCICEPGTPICICDKVSEVRVITKKPILPNEKELGENTRAASAKLRIAERR